MNPYIAALIASVFFGVVVFPWQATLRLLGVGGFLMYAGAVYLVGGLVYYWRFGSPQPLFGGAARVALLSGVLYLAALLLCSYAFSRPGVNTPVAAAITAAFPAWTALCFLIFFRQRFSVLETIFFMMVMVGIVGLSLVAKPAA